MSDLFVSLENWKNEAEIDIDIEVGTPEEVEAVAAEATEEVAEVVEAEGEVEDAAKEAEEMLTQFALCEDMMSYLEENGADRAFMTIYNRNGAFARVFNVTLPSNESFDRVGSPNSSETIACMEGLKETLGKVWDWIKSVCQKVKQFFGRLIEGIKARFGSINGTIGRLRKALEERVEDKSLLKGSKAEVAVFKPSTTSAAAKKAEAAGNEAKTAAEGLAQLITSDIAAGKIESATKEKVTTAIGKMEAAMTEANKMKKTTKVKLSSLNLADIRSGLDDSASAMKWIESAQSEMKKIIHAAQEMEKLADKMKARGDEGAAEASKAAREGVKLLNKLQKNSASSIAFMEWAIRQNLYAAGQYIKAATKKA